MKSARAGQEMIPAKRRGVDAVERGSGARSELEEADGSAEELAARIVRHLMFAHCPPRLPRPRPACAS